MGQGKPGPGFNHDQLMSLLNGYHRPSSLCLCIMCPRVKLLEGRMSLVEPEPVRARVLGQQVEVKAGSPAGRTKSLPEFRLSYFETVLLPTKVQMGGNSPVIGRTLRCGQKQNTGRCPLQQELLWFPIYG